MDVIKLSVWEIIGKPIESVQYEKKKITIIYNKYDCVKTIAGSKAR